MSPEQARGLKSVDHRTDIYSLGMVTYMMLTAQAAFSGESFGDILVAICTQPLPTIHLVAPWLPPSLDAWLKRVCAREPADRYNSIDQMIEGLYAAAGLARPNLKALEVARSDGAGTGEVPARADGSSTARTQAAAGLPPRATTSAVMVTGQSIPKRSVLVPVAIVGLVLGALGGAAIVVLRKPAPTPSALAIGVDVAPSASAAASASAPLPTGAPTATQPLAPSADPSRAGEASRAALQKAATSPKPSGRVSDTAKGGAKVPETKAPPPKPRAATDLGF
jgi:serine/threonine-protein kinase